MKQLASGFEVSYECARGVLDKPACVIVHVLGTANGTRWLTPYEADQLAAVLQAAAAEARGEG